MALTKIANTAKRMAKAIMNAISIAKNSIESPLLLLEAKGGELLLDVVPYLYIIRKFLFLIKLPVLKLLKTKKKVL